MSEQTEAQQPAKDRDAVIIEIGISEVTLLIANQLLDQGSITKEAFLNTTGATFRNIDRERGTIELVMFGKENYNESDINVPFAAAT